jgi:hypothetical protein
MVFRQPLIALATFVLFLIPASWVHAQTKDPQACQNATLSVMDAPSTLAARNANWRLDVQVRVEPEGCTIPMTISPTLFSESGMTPAIASWEVDGTRVHTRTLLSKPALVSVVGRTTTTVSLMDLSMGDVRIEGPSEWRVDVESTGELVSKGQTPKPDTRTPRSSPATMMRSAAPPSLVSITRYSPTSLQTSDDALAWEVTFSGPMSNLDISDFQVNGTTAALALEQGNLVALEADKATKQAELDALNTQLASAIKSHEDNLAAQLAEIDRQLGIIAGLKADAEHMLATQPEKEAEARNMLRILEDLRVKLEQQKATLLAEEPESVTTLRDAVAAKEAEIAAIQAQIDPLLTTFRVTATGGDLADLTGLVTLTISGSNNLADADGTPLASTTATGTNDNSFQLLNDPQLYVIEQTSANEIIVSSETQAQSFIAQPGKLTHIEVVAGSAFSSTLYILEGNGPGGTVLHSQPVELDDTWTDETSFTFSSIALSQPVEVQWDQLYTFRFGDPSAPEETSFAVHTSFDRYHRAEYFEGSASFPTNDMVFKAHIDGRGYPVASNPVISGDLNKDQILTASWDFSDSDGDPEGNTTIQWYRHNITTTTLGAGDAIPGATGTTYALVDTDVGKHIAVEITPHSGSETGSTVRAATGPVGVLPIGVVSIERQSPTEESVQAGSVTFRVTFSDDVVPPGTDAFSLSGSLANQATITSATAASSTEVDVVVSGLAGLAGTIGLNVNGVGGTPGAVAVQSARVWEATEIRYSQPKGAYRSQSTSYSQVFKVDTPSKLMKLVTQNPPLTVQLFNPAGDGWNGTISIDDTDVTFEDGPLLGAGEEWRVDMTFAAAPILFGAGNDVNLIRRLLPVIGIQPGPGFQQLTSGPPPTGLDSVVLPLTLHTSGSIQDTSQPSTVESYTLVSGPGIAINTIAGDDVINIEESSSDVTISGTTSNVEDGQTVTIGLNGKQYQGTVASNAWSVTVPAADAQALPDGVAGQVTADVSDLGGEAADQATRDVTRDGTPPTIVISAISGDDRINTTEDDGDMTISGTTTGAADGQQVTVVLNDQQYQAQVASDAWSVSVPAADVQALDANETVTADVSDMAGNAAVQATRNIEHDTVAPSGYSVALDKDPIGLTAASAVSFAFAGAEVDATFRWSIAPTAAGKGAPEPVTGAGTITTSDQQVAGIDVSSLDEGSLTLTVSLTDPAGNAGAPVTDAAVLDKTAPASPVVASISDDSGASDSDRVTSDKTLVFNGTAEAASTVEVFIDETSIGTAAADGSGNWSFDHTGTDLTEGTLSVSATATDAAGNVSAASAGLNVVVDLTAPASPAVTGISTDSGASASDAITNDQTLQFMGTAEAGLSVEVFIGAVSIGTTTADGSENWTFDHTGTTLPEGVYSVTARQTDLAGNASVPSGALQVTVDLSAPDAPSVVSIVTDSGVDASDQITTDTTPTISGTAPAGASIEVFIDGTTIGSVVADGSGAWSIDHPAGNPLAPGTYAVKATSTDAAGNTSSDSTDLTVVVDTAAPAGYSVSFDQDDVNRDNRTAISFTFVGAEIGASFEWTITSSAQGGTSATGSGTVDAADQQVGGIDVSAVADGTLTLSVSLTDVAGNSGDPATDTITKDVNAPPVAADDAFTTNEDTPLQGNVLSDNGSGADSDADGDELSVNTTPTDDVDHGTLILNGDGSFTYTPAANYSGQDAFTYEVADPDGDSDTGTVSITVNAVNDDPTVVTVPDNVTVIEDVASDVDLSELTFADIDAGVNDIELQVAVGAGVLTAADGGGVEVTGSGSATLTLAGTASEIDTYLNTASAIQYTGSGDANGDDAATLTLTGNDQGQVGSGGGQDVELATVSINITPVNDAPSFTKGADVAVDEDSGDYSAAWATNLSTGPADEAGQTLTFNVSNDNNALFATQPAIASNGTLTFTPAAGANGQATITVSVSDDGGVANGGDDTSDNQQFTITVNAVNDDPTVVSVPSDVTVIEDQASDVDLSALTLTDVDAGANDIELEVSVGAGVLTASDAGGVTVAGSGTGAITLTGTANEIDTYLNTATAIQYTGAGNANGEDAATLTLTGNDQGHVGSGGGQDVALATVNIDITAVNDEPSFTAGADVTVDEDTGAYSAAWATAVSAGPADEAGQTLTFHVTNNTNAGLFAAAPALAANGTLTFTPSAGANGSADITVELRDDGGTNNNGDDTSASSTFTINVSAVNDGPVITLPASPTTLEDTPTTLSVGAGKGGPGGAIFVSDSDAGSNDLTITLTASSTVTLAAGHALDITAGADGSSTLTADGTVAEINAALNGLVYTPTADANGQGTIKVDVSDNSHTGSGGAKTDSKTLTINITAVNDEPSFTKGADVTVDEDSGAYSAAFATAISAGPADEAAQTLSFAVSNNNNALFAVQPSLAANGTLTFTPAAGANGQATVTVSVSDDGGVVNGGDDTSDNQQFTITVNAVNDAPVITLPASPTTLEDTPIAITGAAPKSGAARGGIHVSDSDAGKGDLTITLTATSTVTLTAGHALDITAGADGSSTLTADGTLAEINAALDGLTYTPSADQNGQGSIKVDVTDNNHTGSGGALTDSKTLMIDIEPVNDEPSFTAGPDVSVGEDSGAYSAVWASNISSGPANESDQSVSFLVTTSNQALFSEQPAIAADGTLSFTPADNANGSATITVVLSDDGGTSNGGDDTADAETFTITVSAFNDAPELTMPATASVDEDGSVAIEGVSVEDPDATQLNVSITATSTATLGSTNGLTITGGSNGSSALSFSGSVADVNAALAMLTYAPSANQTTGASLSISVSDGEKSDEGTIEIAINSVNDLPVAQDDALTLPHGTSLPLNVLANDSDLESATLTVVSVTQPSIGSVAINADGTLTVTAGASDEGATSFTYTIEDGDGGQATATVALTITGPGPDGDGIDEDVEANAPNGGDGNGDGTPDAQQNNVASVPVATGENQGQYMTLVSPANTGLQQVYSTDIPDPEQAPENVEFPIGRVAFKVTNPDVGQMSVVDIIMPRGVEVVSYYKYGPTPDNSEDHWYEFLFDGDTGAIIHPETVDSPPRVELHLIDGQRGDADLTANGVIDDPGVPIFKTNKLPVTAADAAVIDEDTSTSIDVLANDSDADQDVLSITNIMQPANGKVTLEATGQVTYAPNADFNGTDTFTYVISDGNGAPVSGTVSITVNPTPDAPVAVADAATTDEETAVTIPIFANDSDADGDAFFLINGATSANAEVVYDGAGSIIYTPHTGFDGLDRFSYTISDPSGLTATGWVEVTVSGTNDAPVAAADATTTEEDTSVSINVLANDSDEEGDALSITEWTEPSNGAVQLSDGQLVYTPTQDYSGTDSFTYTVSDGELNVTSNVTITVTSVNDSPVFESETAVFGPAGVFMLADAPYEADYTEATDVDSDNVTHVWELLRGANSEEVLFSRPVEDGSINVSADELIAALEPHGLIYGSQVTFFQRLKATDDEGAEGTSTRQEVTFARAINVSNEDEAGIPTDFFLSDNYPNPFNPSTTIEFGLPQAAHVSIQLFDMSGRMVQVITDRQLAPGTHTERIDMGTLPSGVYLYRMTTGSHVFSKTLHLIK